MPFEKLYFHAILQESNYVQWFLSKVWQSVKLCSLMLCIFTLYLSLLKLHASLFCLKSTILMYFYTKTCITQLLLLLLYLKIILCCLWHFQHLQDYSLLWVSWFNFKNLDLQEIFKKISFPHCPPILLSYMDQFIIFILVISLEHVSEGVLTDARTNLCALILSLPWLTWVTLQTSSRCCFFFNISLGHFLKHFSILSKTLILFHKLNNKAFYSKTGTKDFIFILVSILKTYILVSMLKIFTHWVSP